MPGEIRTLIDSFIGQACEVGIDPRATPANTPRNPAFRREAKKWLQGKVCMVCGGTKRLMCHHKYPFHLFPSLEMDERYWRPMCEGDKRLNCHILVGHAGNTMGFLPMVDELAGLLRFALRTNKILLAAIREEIKNSP